MAKDHYVAQTYLQGFSIDGRKGFVNVIRKSKLQRLDEIPVQSICYEIDWSSNEYFSENPRVVEEFLKPLESKWSNCVRSISTDTYNATTKYLMAGYLAYLRACTPTAVRLGADALRYFAHDLYNWLEEKELSNPNTEHREAIKTICELGGTKVLIKEAFPKAIGISTLIGIQKVLANSPWIVFRNETPLQLLTSDNPVCMQYWNSNQCDVYCPINPWLAIVIHPLREKEPRGIDSVGSLKLEGVERLNRLIVQSAEDKVIFNEHPYIESFVNENKDWGVELQTLSIPTEKGKFILHQQRPVKRKQVREFTRRSS